jgi:NADPH-dependent 2,4-dienoyl-CoA reductase/sulfur reductase-like enzyme
VAVIVGTWQAQLLLQRNRPAHCSILSRFEAGRCELGPGVGVPPIAQDLRAKQAPNMVDAGVTIAPACHTGHRRCTVLGAGGAGPAAHR